MTLANEIEVPCLFCTQPADLRKKQDFRGLTISADQLVMFDRSRAVRRTELELSRIRQFAGEAGVSIPGHFWDILHRVLIVRFSWPCLECRDCEAAASKTFIMSVVALAVVNPGRTDRLLVHDARGWINHAAAYLLDADNCGATSRLAACDFVSDLFVATDESGRYRRPKFVRSFSYGRRFSSNHFVIVGESDGHRFYHEALRLSKMGHKVNAAFLSQSNCNEGFLHSERNFLKLNIPRDRKLATEVPPSLDLHSLKELSLRSVVVAAMERETSQHLSRARTFKDEIAEILESLSTPKDSSSSASELKRLERVLEEFRDFVKTRRLPQLSFLKPHAFLRCVIETRCRNAIDSVSLLQQNSNPHARNAPEELRHVSPASRLSEMKSHRLEEMGNQLSARLVSDLKVLETLLRSTTIPDLSVEASESFKSHLADSMRHGELSLRTLASVRSILDRVGARFRSNGQSGDFPCAAMRLVHSFCSRLSQDLYELWSGSFGHHWLHISLRILEEEVTKLDEFHSSEMTLDQLNRFLVARLLEDVATVQMFSEHIGALNHFAVSFAKVRFLVNREPYIRRCLTQIICDDVDIECVLHDINVSAIC